MSGLLFLWKFESPLWLLCFVRAPRVRGRRDIRRDREFRVKMVSNLLLCTIIWCHGWLILGIRLFQSNWIPFVSILFLLLLLLTMIRTIQLKNSNRYSTTAAFNLLISSASKVPPLLFRLPVVIVVLVVVLVLVAVVYSRELACFHGRWLRFFPSICPQAEKNFQLWYCIYLSSLNLFFTYGFVFCFDFDAGFFFFWAIDRVGIFRVTLRKIKTAEAKLLK